VVTEARAMLAHHRQPAQPTPKEQSSVRPGRAASPRGRATARRGGATPCCCARSMQPCACAAGLGQR
jgi:hypothetical protein